MATGHTPEQLQVLDRGVCYSGQKGMSEAGQQQHGERDAHETIKHAEHAALI